MKRWRRPVSGQEEEKIVEMEWVVLLNNVKKRKKDRPEWVACLVPVFIKLFLRTVFENTENIKMMFSGNCSCFLNLVFSMFWGTKHVLPVFENNKR